MKNLILLGVFGSSITVFSQNLIKNPEFTTSGKVYSKAQIHSADGWSNANGGSVDLFSTKSCSPTLGVPNNFMGDQASSGNYAGLTAYYDDQYISVAKSLRNKEITGEKGYSKYSEYLQGELLEELKAGQTYYFSFNVSLADNSGRAVNGLGAYFSKAKLNHSNNRALEYVPQVVSQEFITDENGWTKISGSFVAEGGEKHFSIGAYKGSFTVETIVEPKIENDNKRAYYYVNGISLSTSKLADNDSDGDGILDEDDHCPDVAGVAEFHGCLLSSDDLEMIKKTSENLFFSTGSSTLSDNQKTELDALAKLLLLHPEVKATIKGHTDSVGSDESNLILSKERANSVKNYLASKGIDDNHISTYSYGETKPVATNETTEGRAENRHALINITTYKEKKK